MFCSVSFPSSVQWMTLEFDPQCGTAQPEDSLQVIPLIINFSWQFTVGLGKLRKGLGYFLF